MRASMYRPGNTVHLQPPVMIKSAPDRVQQILCALPGALIGFWPLNELPDSLVAKDLGPNHYHGTVVNAKFVGSSDGRPCAYFDATAYIDCFTGSFLLGQSTGISELSIAPWDSTNRYLLAIVDAANSPKLGVNKGTVSSGNLQYFSIIGGLPIPSATFSIPPQAEKILSNEWFYFGGTVFSLTGSAFLTGGRACLRKYHKTIVNSGSAIVPATMVKILLGVRIIAGLSGVWKGYGRNLAGWNVSMPFQKLQNLCSPTEEWLN